MRLYVRICILFCVLLSAVEGYGQVFWTEDFNAPVCNCEAAAYVGANGAWGIDVLAPGGFLANKFYVSCRENGENVGSCGAGCGANPTLHVSTSFSDLGAAYLASSSSATFKRAFSPVIDCSGKSTITISFKYLEGGEGIDDNAILVYFDGATWQNLVDLPKTVCCGGNPCTGGNQGVWTSFSWPLPATANNNPNVRIGFQWFNDNDANGTDPSFAVDDITLSLPLSIITESVTPAPFCAGGPINVPFTSFGTFNPGNVYTAQLSDASGSFDNPVILGTLAGTANTGTITATLPLGTVTGGGYQVRIVSSDPAVTGSLSGAITITAPDVTTSSTSYDVCSGFAPAITLNSSVAGTTFTWTGDDGSSGSSNPINTILVNSNCTNRTVTYTITPSNNGCTGPSITRPVTVRPYPTSYFSITPNPACSDVSALATYTGTSCPGASFNWTFPTGTTVVSGSGAGPYQLQWAASGEKHINLQVVNPGGACTSLLTRDTISVIGAPALTPPDPCAGSTPEFTAGGGNFYEFFVNGVSQGPAGTTANFTPASALVAGQQVCVRSYNMPQITFDGLITETEWGTALARSTGGPPVSGFGLNNLDALYLNNGYGNLNIALAGRLVNEANPNKILLFIDSKAGGFNSLATWTNRTNSPYYSIRNLDGGITFDPGFNPDYIIGINGNLGDYFFDLYDMQANVNTYLGSDNGSAQLGYTPNSGFGDFYRGFEFRVPLASVGNPSGTIQVFAMIVNDPGSGAATFLSNQFLTRANSTSNNYGNGSVTFGNAAPNPVPYAIGMDCYKETCITVQSPVTPTFNALPPFCENAAAPSLPGTSLEGINGTWSPSVISNTAGGTYTFTPDSGQCATGGSLSTTVIPLPTTSPVFHD